jgi:hypothetical protein
LDVKQAAEIIGISSEGIRKRIKRGTLDHEKGPDGKVYVWLDTDRTDSNGNGSNTQLAKALQEQVEMLRGELKDWKRIVTTRDEELRRKDHIIAALTERIPELEAPPKPQQEDTSTNTPSKAKTTQETPRNDPTSKRNWWQRLRRK